MSKYVLNQKSANGEEAEARAAFSVGMELYGYCGGIFGRDSHGTKTILRIEGNSIQVREQHWVNSEKTFLNIAEVRSWVELLGDSNDSLRSIERDEEREKEND